MTKVLIGYVGLEWRRYFGFKPMLIDLKNNKTRQTLRVPIIVQDKESRTKDGRVNPKIRIRITIEEIGDNEIC